jgi:phosphopantetheinyl transferase (holo-ACP synthase)
MIGNDIVDLRFASSGKHWKSRRFLDKVFSFEEQKVIADSENSFSALWKLWTMKESAYKIHVRRYGKPFFNPLNTACQILSETEGRVIINNNRYHSSSRISDEYIYTITHSSTSGKVITECDKLINTDYVTQHNESHRSVLNAFAELWNCDVETLAIRKNEAGVPSVYKNNIKQMLPFSITHHGQYYGYALAIS